MFSGKRAIITGASSGIGWALSARLAKLGCGITMIARNEQKLAANLKLLPSSEGQHHEYRVADLETLGVCDKTQNTMKLLFPSASILVNCAGVTTHHVLARLKPETVTKTIHVNLVAPILLSQMAVMPFMRHARQSEASPSILNLSSMLSVSGICVPGTTAYAALKAGLLGFTQLLSHELNGKIRVNAVLPALVPETDMGKSGSPTLPTVLLEAVVNACIYALSDESVNGKFIVADAETPRFLNCNS